MKFKVAERLAQIEEYYFSKKLQEIQQMNLDGCDVINLGIGNPDLAPPNNVQKIAAEVILKDNSHGYASYKSIPELRSALSSWYESTYDVKLNPENEILPLLGSKEGIFYLSMAMLNPGDQVLIPNPGYPAYASVARLLGAEILYYELTEQNHWCPDLESLKKLDLSRCKLMWVNYPHMPTGQVVGPDFFHKLIDFAKEKKIIICNDNPYSLILNESAPLSLLKVDIKKEVSIELNSLSKSFNMAGWRVGAILGPKEVIDAVLRVKSNVDSGMFLPVQFGAIEALRTDEDWHKNRNQIYKRRRQIIWDIFDLLNFTYDKNQVGLFVWARAPDHIKEVASFLDTVLKKSYVFITPGMIFGTGGLRYARLSLCANEETLLKAKTRLENHLRGQQ